MNSNLEQKRHPKNLKNTWVNQTGHISLYAGPDPEYKNLFKKHYGSFKGTILEIGAGTGYFAKHILENYSVKQYTILDISRNITELQTNYLKDFKQIKYIDSEKYEQIFNQKYDLLIETHCLSETPRYYYSDILEKINVDNCLIIDESTDPTDLEFNETVSEWASAFRLNEGTHRSYEIAGLKKTGTMVYIGKGGRDAK